MAKFKRKTKEERTHEIIEAAKKVFLKKGFHNTTMEDIVAATSLSKGGVYQYFKSTKAIMFAIMQEGNYFIYNIYYYVCLKNMLLKFLIFYFQTRQ